MSNQLVSYPSSLVSILVLANTCHIPGPASLTLTFTVDELFNMTVNFWDAWCQGRQSGDQFCELHHFMNMYNYFLKARVSLRTLSSLVINLFTQVAIVLELALVSSHLVDNYMEALRF